MFKVIGSISGLALAMAMGQAVAQQTTAPYAPSSRGALPPIERASPPPSSSGGLRVPPPMTRAPVSRPLPQSAPARPAPVTAAPMTAESGPNSEAARAPGRRVVVSGGALPNQPRAERGLRTVGSSFLGGRLRTDGQITENVLSFQEGLTDDVPFFLRRLADGEMAQNSLYVGGRIRGGFYAEKTNTDGKFPLLSRFPNQHGNGDTNEDAVIQNAAVYLAANWNSWITAYAHIEHSEVFFRPEEDNVQLREGYVVLGNLERSPFYAAVGRKTIDFGNFDTFTPFTHSVNQHYFWALSEDPVVEVGYIKGGLRLSGTLIDGDRQIRVAQGERDKNPGNFALKAENTFSIERLRGDATVSVSYLHDTIYNNNFTAHTREALGRGGAPNAPAFPNVFVQDRVGLISVSGIFRSEKFDLGTEYTRATDKWPATAVSGVTGEVYDDVPVLQAITLQGRYRFDLMGKDANVSAVLSRGIFGPDDTEFDHADQHSLALEVALTPWLDGAVEYVYNDGFQPFVGIQDVSDSDVQSHTVIIGGSARF